MKPLKFRIQNYKSIVDSGECYFSDRLTILAGKNESGKSSVLEALEDFHQDKTIREEAKRIEDPNLLPEISVTFEIDNSEINEVFEKIESDITISSNISITLTKRLEETITYTLDDESRKLIGIPDLYEISRKQVLNSIQKIEGHIKATDTDVKFPKFNKQFLSDYKTEVNTFKTLNPTLIEVAEEIINIDKASDDYYASEKLCRKFINALVESKLPYFILFSSFDDKFPKSIPIASLTKNVWAQDLEHVSNFTISKMASTNQQEQVNHEKTVNVDFSEKFDKYWTQDKIKLEVKKDGQEINFWVVENDKLYYPSQRSKGQQWYLAFYVKIVARLQENKPNVILIDEPGLYLHAKAQKDLLQVLLQHTDDNPVIFSTHSPYLITENNLENVRLIEKTENGTKILGKIHAHSTANKETLTPILTAIGLGINDSIINFDQKENVVVEGPEDVFYLQAFKALEYPEIKTNFVNGGGASNMGIVGTILEGWGANVCYLYDNDQGKKDGVKNLKAWKIASEAIKTVLKKDGSTIIDIFSVSDFKTHILENETLDYTSSNSEYIKSLKPKPDKVLLARKFLQKVKNGSVELNQETKDNITGLFKEITFKADLEKLEK